MPFDVEKNKQIVGEGTQKRNCVSTQTTKHRVGKWNSEILEMFIILYCETTKLQLMMRKSIIYSDPFRLFPVQVKSILKLYKHPLSTSCAR